VPIPAYQALQKEPGNGRADVRDAVAGCFDAAVCEVLPRMAETVGVSKSAISERAIEASAAQLEQLLGRRWEDAELLVIYIDGMQFGTYHVISAVGVDETGAKHVLGLQLGATENTAAVKALLIHLRSTG